MILPAVGLPGRFAERCENLLCRLAAAGCGEPAFFVANSLQELGARLLPGESLHAVVVVRRPRADLAETLRRSGKPFLIALEEPQACVAALMQDHGVGFLAAVRAVANALSTILPLIYAPTALILRAAEHSDSTALAKVIATHYGLAVDDAIAQTVAVSVERDVTPSTPLAPPFHMPQAEPAQSPFDPDFSRMLPDLMTGALQPAWAALTQGPQEIHWHRDLFQDGDHPGQPPPPVLDVTGLGRCLVYGPYIHLPAGSWSCSLTLGCSKLAVGLKMIAEIFAADVLGRVSFEISEPGFFEIEFSCVLPSQDCPVEIRLFNAAATFEGHIALIQATMKPLKAVRIPVKTV